RSRTSMLRALDQPSSAPATGVDPSAPLVRFLRRHRGARVTLSGLSVVLGLVAAGMLAYPFYTNLYQSRLQDRLDRQLVSPALKPGDEIILQTPVGTCTYKIAKAPFVVLPSDTSVVAPSKDGELTLTTCHPKGSASHRLVVRALLQGPAIST